MPVDKFNRGRYLELTQVLPAAVIKATVAGAVPGEHRGVNPQETANRTVRREAQFVEKYNYTTQMLMRRQVAK